MDDVAQLGMGDWVTNDVAPLRVGAGVAKSLKYIIIHEKACTV